MSSQKWTSQQSAANNLSDLLKPALFMCKNVEVIREKRNGCAIFMHNRGPCPVMHEAQLVEGGFFLLNWGFEF